MDLTKDKYTLPLYLLHHNFTSFITFCSVQSSPDLSIESRNSLIIETYLILVYLVVTFSRRAALFIKLYPQNALGHLSETKPVLCFGKPHKGY